MAPLCCFGLSSSARTLVNCFHYLHSLCGPQKVYLEKQGVFGLSLQHHIHPKLWFRALQDLDMRCSQCWEGEIWLPRETPSLEVRGLFYTVCYYVLSESQHIFTSRRMHLWKKPTERGRHTSWLFSGLLGQLLPGSMSVMRLHFRLHTLAFWRKNAIQWSQRLLCGKSDKC